MIARGKLDIQDLAISEWDITSDNISKLQFERNGKIYEFPSSDAVHYPIYDSLSGITIKSNRSYYFEQQDIIHFYLDLTIEINTQIDSINLPLPYISLHPTLGQIEISNTVNNNETTNLGTCKINSGLTHIMLISKLFDPLYMPYIDLKASIIYKKDD